MRTVLSIVLRRIGLGLVTLWVVSVIIFLAVELLPGDLAEQMLGQAATPETVAAFRRELGLDQPPVQRYFSWLGAVLGGDFGTSLATGREISDLLWPRLGNTLFLAAFAAVVSVTLAISLGVLAAIYRNSLFDRLINIVTLSFISLPEFFLAYILLLLFAVQWGLFPSLSNISPEAGFAERLYTTALPALTLTLVVVAHMMRMTRAAIVNVLAAPYIEMARLKGVRRSRIIVAHALPNALAPILNVVALNLAYLVVGAVVVEVVFVYPGLGQLLVDAVSKRDITIVQAACLTFACIYILLNLAADVLSIVTNPRLIHPR